MCRLPAANDVDLGGNLGQAGVAGTAIAADGRRLFSVLGTLIGLEGAGDRICRQTCETRATVQRSLVGQETVGGLWGRTVW